MGLGSIVRTMRKGRGLLPDAKEAASRADRVPEFIQRFDERAASVGYRVDQRVADRLNEHPTEFALGPGEAVVDGSVLTLRSSDAPVSSGISVEKAREANAVFESDVKLGNFLDRGLIGFHTDEGVRTVGAPVEEGGDWWDQVQQVDLTPSDIIVQLDEDFWAGEGFQRRGVFTAENGLNRRAGFTEPEQVGEVRREVQRRARNYGMGVAGVKGWQAGEAEVERRTDVDIPDPYRRSSQLVSQRFR